MPGWPGMGRDVTGPEGEVRPGVPEEEGMGGFPPEGRMQS